MKPTNSPTPGQPNPRKIRLKVAFGPLFPTANIASWVGSVLHRKQTTGNVTQSNSLQTPYEYRKDRLGIRMNTHTFLTFPDRAVVGS